MHRTTRILQGRASRVRPPLDASEARERLRRLTREIARLRHVGHELGEMMMPDKAIAAHCKADELEREADKLTASLFTPGPTVRPYSTNQARTQAAATRLVNQEIDGAYWRHDPLRELARDKADEAFADLWKNNKRRVS